MIKCDFGDIEIKGSRSIVQAELTTLIYAFKKRGIATKEELEKALKMALAPNVEEEAKKFEKISDKVDDLLDELKKLMEED